MARSLPPCDMVPVQVRLPARLYVEIKARADAQGRSTSHAIRQLIIRGLRAVEET